MYRRPTDEELQYGLEEGGLEEIGDQERRGYGIFTRSAMECDEINRYDACYYNEPMPSDEDCAIEAERSGFCKIIPISELPENFKTEFGDDARWFGWVDTPKNRKTIADWTARCC